MQYDAVVLAGGESSGELRKIAPYDNEALIIIGKYPMIYYIYHALRQSALVDRIVVSGPVDSLRSLLPRDDRLYFVPGGENAVASFTQAADFLKEQGIGENLLILPADIPFITAEAIDDFIGRSQETEAEFYYSITRREVNEEKFPGVKRTYVKLQDGVFTGGNLFILRSQAIDRVLDLACQLVQRRKNPIAMGKLFGLGLVFKYLFGRLSIAMVEKRFQEMMGIRGRAIISPYAEVGVDVDKPSDLELAHRYLSDVRF
jgi:molybdopterin-guanine dinucleotide biosynthesis protein A